MKYFQNVAKAYSGGTCMIFPVNLEIIWEIYSLVICSVGPVAMILPSES